MYTTPFLLTEPVGNNAFSYEKRTNTTLHIPSIIDGDFSHIKEGTQIVFEDFYEHNILRSCTGLEHFVRTSWCGIPLVVFDNHNHALYFWYEALSQGIIDQKSTLVHIDEHSDLWKNTNDIKDPLDIFHFTNYECNVGNYIEPALRSGIIGKMLRIEDTIGMEKYADYQA